MKMTEVPLVKLNDGSTIPQLGVGVWQVPPEQTTEVVRKALQVGYRHIDTAAAYGNEQSVGAAIAESGIPREELYVTTKLWVSDFKNGDPRQALEASLQELGMDRVDLYLIHWPAPEDRRYIDAWLALERLQAAGLTRSIGVSNFLPEHLDAVAEAGSVTPAVNQIEIHPALQQRQTQATNEKYGIATQAWSPLGQGTTFDAEPIVAAAQNHSVSAAQVIIRWHLQQGRILFPKSVTPARIEQNFDVFGFELTDQELAAIDGLERDERTGFHPAEFNPA